MNSKVKVLTLVSIIVVATIAASLVIAAEISSAKANVNSNVSQDATLPQTSTSVVNATDNGTAAFNGCPDFGGFRGGFRDMGMGRGFGGPMGPMGFGQIQVSSDFTANVTSIAQNDTDVANLISQGYNITEIRPMITTTIDGNGNVVTQATTAQVLLQGTNGKALVTVDLTQDKVTKIQEFTWTEIDK